MKNVMMGRLQTAWVFNFERLDSAGHVVSEDQPDQRASDEDQPEAGMGVAPQILKNTDTHMIYVNLPPPEGATNAPHLLWGFNDLENGTDPDLIFKIPQPLSNFAMFESNTLPLDDKRRNRSWKTYSSSAESKGTEKAPLWGVSTNRKLILKLNPDDGTVMKQIILDSVLNMTSAVITSKLMVARKMKSTEDILIFGVQITPTKTGKMEFQDLKSNRSSRSSPKNYVVCLTENNVNWVYETPHNREVKGQIAGIRQTAKDGSDVLVVFTSDTTESEIFALKFE
jgi:hypothetical protein